MGNYYDAKQAFDAFKEKLAYSKEKRASQSGAYQSQWQTQLDDTINKILNREKFSYDLNGDALYQQYKDKYIQQGKLAMGDAIGQASALTGGYGSSYAQSVGQQAYQAHLNNLNDIVPELYAMAYDKYNQEGQDMYNQYAMLGAEEDRDYGRYRDTVADSKWQKEFEYQQGRDEVKDSQWQKEFESVYGRGDNAADSKTYLYSGTTSDALIFNNGTKNNAEIKALQAVLGVPATGYYTEETKNAADGLSADEAYDKFVGAKKLEIEGGGPEFVPVDSAMVQKIMESIPTKEEYDKTAFPGKSHYSGYEDYIDKNLKELYESGRLTESEVATLIAHYGLS